MRRTFQAMRRVNRICGDILPVTAAFSSVTYLLHTYYIPTFPQFTNYRRFFSADSVKDFSFAILPNDSA